MPAAGLALAGIADVRNQFSIVLKGVHIVFISLEMPVALAGEGSTSPARQSLITAMYYGGITPHYALARIGAGRIFAARPCSSSACAPKLNLES